MQKIIITSLLILLHTAFVFAQEFSYGFKAGLNFSRISTDDIEQFDGMDLETFDQNSGFHLGIAVTTKFSEIFGARGEFLFSQKGGRYDFQGPSYTNFSSFTGDNIESQTGFRSMNINISNAYIDIPLSLYLRPLKWLEISAGANVAVLISSTAAGEMNFTIDGQAEEDAFRAISLDYRYFKDQRGESIPENGEEIRMINGTSFKIPKTIKAYYDLQSGAETGLFNRLDFGLHASANFYINKSLYVGARFNYGLVDITDNKSDRSLVSEDLVLRDDIDRNLSMQASIGFSF